MIGPRVNGLPAPDWASGQLTGDVDASWFVSAVLGQVVSLFLGSVSVVFYFLSHQHLQTVTSDFIYVPPSS